MSRDRSSKIEGKRNSKGPLGLEQSEQKKQFGSEGSGHVRLCKPL